MSDASHIAAFLELRHYFMGLFPQVLQLQFCFFDSPNSCNIIQEVYVHLKKKKGKILNKFEFTFVSSWLNFLLSLSTVLNHCSDPSPFIGCGRPFGDISLSPHPESTMRVFSLLKSRLFVEAIENPYFSHIIFLNSCYNAL